MIPGLWKLYMNSNGTDRYWRDILILIELPVSTPALSSALFSMIESEDTRTAGFKVIIETLHQSTYPLNTSIQHMNID